MLAPLGAADVPPGASGYRPKRSAQDAGWRVAEAMVQDTTRVIDVDVPASLDPLRPHLLLAQGAPRGKDPDVLPGRKLRLQAAGKKGVAQGGVLSPFRRHLSLPAGARRRERATEVPRRGPYPSREYARVAADRGSLVEASPPHARLRKAVDRRRREARATRQGTRHEEQSRSVELAQGERVSFLGCDCRRVRSRPGAWRSEGDCLL